jgi:hypothetical protein
MKSVTHRQGFKLIRFDASSFKNTPETSAEEILGAVDQLTYDRGTEVTTKDFLLYMRKRHLEDALKQYRAAKKALAMQVDYTRRRLNRLDRETIIGEVQKAVTDGKMVIGL